MNLKTRSTRLRMASMLDRTCWHFCCSPAAATTRRTKARRARLRTSSAPIDLTVEDGSFNKTTVNCKAGTIKITVSVPSDADGKHGVGIDGGQYKDIKGAPVAPGRSTSLTVAVTKGEYTIFDSYKNNRDKGYETKLTVK